VTKFLISNRQVVYENIGGMMMNATLFLGTILEQKEELLVNLSKKYFCQIFSTFILRISTSFDENFVTATKSNK
jgi:hypothetical protein